MLIQNNLMHLESLIRPHDVVGEYVGLKVKMPDTNMDQDNLLRHFQAVAEKAGKLGNTFALLP